MESTLFINWPTMTNGDTHTQTLPDIRMSVRALRVTALASRQDGDCVGGQFGGGMAEWVRVDGGGGRGVGVVKAARKREVAG